MLETLGFRNREAEQREARGGRREEGRGTVKTKDEERLIVLETLGFRNREAEQRGRQSRGRREEGRGTVNG